MKQKRLKDALQDKLDLLNQNVELALSSRETFLDENMNVFAEFMVGEQVYNVSTGHAGMIEKHYRYWKRRRRDLDSSFSVECEIRDYGNPWDPEKTCCIDNTSHYGGVHPYVRLVDYTNKTEKYHDKLELWARINGRR